MSPEKDPNIVIWLLGGLLTLIGGAWLAALSYIQYDGAVKNRDTNERVVECNKRNDKRFIPRTEFDSAREQHNRDITGIDENIKGLFELVGDMRVEVGNIAGQLGCKNKE